MDVLLIEPDKLLGSIIKETFSKSGHNASWAKTAQEALDVLEECPADVIVLEINLGVHNGVEFLYEIRSYSDWHDIPVVVYTSNHRVLDSVFAGSLAQLGVVMVLGKTQVSIDRLVELSTKTGYKK